MSYNEIFDWVFFQSPWWAKIFMMVAYYALAAGGLFIVDHFNPYLRD